MRRVLIALAALALSCAGSALWAATAWEEVWKGEDAARQTSLTGSARTTILLGDKERTAIARVAASNGRMRFDYETSRGRWSLVDDGQRLVRLSPDRKQASVLPRPAFAVDRRLAERNYVARVTGEAAVAGRPTRVIEIRPAGGGPVVRRVWLDGQTSFPLKRERYNAEGRLTSGTEYIDLKFGAAPPPETFAIPRGWNIVDEDGSGVRLELPELERRIGFPVLRPKYVPPGYVLLGGNLQQRGRWEMESAELRYTDGLRLLSVFERQREEERAGPGGRHGLERGRSGERGGGRGRDSETGEERRGRGGGHGFGPPSGEEMTLLDRGSEKALRFRGKDRVVIVVGDLPAEELMRIARSVG